MLVRIEHADGEHPFLHNEHRASRHTGGHRDDGFGFRRLICAAVPEVSPWILKECIVSESIVLCPSCGTELAVYRNPFLTVDAIVTIPGQGVVLIHRRNPPHGWALPGGFVDYGESLEEAVRREILEETGLELERLAQFKAYSDPGRDPRHHTVTVVFSAYGLGLPRAADDAERVSVFPLDRLPSPLAFDHAEILADYCLKLAAQGG
jgi:ADP-ribose pyrophosphatase YjhB (NUDIX family)